MRLIKFRIYNYKSIIDSGYCRLASDLTLLVGKNESGKTAILEALRDFDREIVKVSYNAYPLDLDRDEPLIELSFRLTTEDIQNIQAQADAQFSKQTYNDILQNGLMVTKNAKGVYAFPNEYFDTQEPSVEEYVEESYEDNHAEADCKLAIVQTRDELAGLLQGHPLAELYLDAEQSDIKRQVREVFFRVKQILPSIGDDDLQQKVVQLLRALNRQVEELFSGSSEVSVQPQKTDERSRLMSAVVGRLPRFVFFSEFMEVLPFDVPLTQLKEHKSILDFAKITGLDLDELIQTDDIQRRINILSRHSATVSGDFLDYWKQHQTEIVARPEGDRVLFGVKDHNRTEFYKIEQRSKGFQWFLSFYLRLNAHKNENTIILIDEPGRSLHPKAQSELVKILEYKISPESQVIVSTHSPYLADTSRLDRVRLVIKDSQKGSAVRNDLSENNIDDETLLPITTALSMNVVNNVSLFGNKNVVLSGFPNFYLFKAYKECVQSKSLEGINIIPSINDENTKQVVSLMIAYGLDFRLILGKTEEEKKLACFLIEKLGVDKDQFVYIPSHAENFLEKLLSQEDLEKYILCESSNSKGNSANRVVLFKDFLNKVKENKEKIQLSDASLESLNRFFEDVAHSFNGQVMYSEKELKDENLLPDTEPTRRSFFSVFKK